jgi:hypothetical protein
MLSASSLTAASSKMLRVGGGLGERVEGKVAVFMAALL